jgi:predicted nucleic acid-binding Zn ribbon protein
MATAGITPGQTQRSRGEGEPSTWLERFTSPECDELLHDDLVAGRSIAVILVLIFLMGLLLSAVAVLMSR